MPDGNVLLADSATKLFDEHRGQVVICGSHGGVYPAYLAARAGLRAVILNDAGVGLDRAGLGCLDYCNGLGMAAATCCHDSARIGDALDMAARGRISHVNRIAADLGCAPGDRLSDTAERLRRAAWRAWDAPAYEEARVVMADDGRAPHLICLDSVSLVSGDDIGQIVLTGSHGGLMAGRAQAALKVDALAAIFNDAGVGIDEAGLGRLAALDHRGIAGATVGGMTARIGDGVSTYEDGVISHVNQRARALGLQTGMTARQAVDCLRDGQAGRDA